MVRRTMSLGLLVLALAACGSGLEGGDNAGAPDGVAPPSSGADPGATSAKSGDFTAAPVQLTLDPCALVTKAEAERVIGQSVAVGATTSICTYTATGDGGVLSVELDPPDYCKLLFLALDQDLFGGDQVRVDDIGQGGMLVKGNGNVQFVADGGCVTIASGAGLQPFDDATMLALAETAAERAS